MSADSLEAALMHASSLFEPPKPILGRGPLHAGSTWVGVQRSGRNEYDVKVKIDTVDVESGTLTGTLEIRDLTPELDSLVTFFEGEIVSETGPGFLTNNYGATREDDMRHWKRFPPFVRNRLEQQMAGDKLNLKGASKKPYLFMRWKEKFVLPEHKVEAIHGASFAGLYYLCLDFEPAASELFAEASPPLHRTTVPPSSRPFSITSPLPRRRLSPSTAPSQLAQTRPSPPSAFARSLSSNGPISTVPVAPQPRPSPPQRSMSASVSYAAALRGSSPTSSIASSSISSMSTSASTSFSQLSATPPTPSATPPSGGDVPTPKSEYDPSFVAPAAAADPVTALDRLSRSQFVSFLDTAPSPILVSSTTPASPTLDAEWPVPSSPPTQPTGPFGSSRRRTTSFGSVDIEEHNSTSRRGRPEESRKDKAMPTGVKGSETFGIRSWTEANLTGFYHFACSEPYQQLSLRYVPTTNGSSQTFAFR
ncbi:hypothetical protein JCM10212_005613 [Sporobolomyces blumeae]